LSRSVPRSLEQERPAPGHVFEDVVDSLGSGDGADSKDVVSKGKGLCLATRVVLRRWKPKIERLGRSVVKRCLGA